MEVSLKKEQVFSKSTKKSILETLLIFLLLAAVKIALLHGAMKATKQGLVGNPWIIRITVNLNIELISKKTVTIKKAPQSIIKHQAPLIVLKRDQEIWLEIARILKTHFSKRRCQIKMDKWLDSLKVLSSRITQRFFSQSFRLINKSKIDFRARIIYTAFHSSWNK